MADQFEREPTHIPVEGPESGADVVPVHTSELSDLGVPNGGVAPEQMNPELPPGELPLKYGREVLSQLPNTPENQDPPR